MRQSVVIDPEQTEDWQLVCYLNQPEYAANLPAEAKEQILLETWWCRDGSGPRGHVPFDGETWEELQNAGPIAKARMASACRRILKDHGITAVEAFLP